MTVVSHISCLIFSPISIIPWSHRRFLTHHPLYDFRPFALARERPQLYTRASRALSLSSIFPLSCLFDISSYTSSTTHTIVPQQNTRDASIFHTYAQDRTTQHKTTHTLNLQNTHTPHHHRRHRHANIPTTPPKTATYSKSLPLKIPTFHLLQRERLLGLDSDIILDTPDSITSAGRLIDQRVPVLYMPATPSRNINKEHKPTTATATSIPKARTSSRHSIKGTDKSHGRQQSPALSTSATSSSTYTHYNNTDNTMSKSSTSSGHHAEMTYYIAPNLDTLDTSACEMDAGAHNWVQPIIIEDDDLTFGGKSLSAWYEEDRRRLSHSDGEEAQRGRERVRRSYTSRSGRS